eukprot:5152162-Amphidinium_carterae.1
MLAVSSQVAYRTPASMAACVTTWCYTQNRLDDFAKIKAEGKEKPSVELERKDLASGQAQGKPHGRRGISTLQQMENSNEEQHQDRSGTNPPLAALLAHERVQMFALLTPDLQVDDMSLPMFTARHPRHDR